MPEDNPTTAAVLQELFGELRKRKGFGETTVQTLETLAAEGNLADAKRVVTALESNPLVNK